MLVPLTAELLQPYTNGGQFGTFNDRGQRIRGEISSVTVDGRTITIGLHWLARFHANYEWYIEPGQDRYIIVLGTGDCDLVFDQRLYISRDRYQVTFYPPGHRELLKKPADKPK